MEINGPKSWQQQWISKLNEKLPPSKDPRSLRRSSRSSIKAKRIRVSHPHLQTRTWTTTKVNNSAFPSRAYFSNCSFYWSNWAPFHEGSSETRKTNQRIDSCWTPTSVLEDVGNDPSSWVGNSQETQRSQIRTNANLWDPRRRTISPRKV